MTENAPGGSPPAVEMTPEGVRAEVGRVMSDQAHPHHGGWTRGDQQAKDYVQGLYERLYPGKGTVALGEGLSVGGTPEPAAGETPEAAEARARDELILAPLKQEWGERFEAEMAGCRQEARELFAADDGTVLGEVFENLGATIRAKYGPKGETLALKFLADLGRIRKGG